MPVRTLAGTGDQPKSSPDAKGHALQRGPAVRGLPTMTCKNRGCKLVWYPDMSQKNIRPCRHGPKDGRGTRKADTQTRD